MSTIICFDIYGRKHQFEESEFVNREAVYGIFIQKDTFLLVKDTKSGNWEIPGGGNENDETDVECLKREFYEETGLIIDKKITKHTEEINYFYDVASHKPWKTARKYYEVTSVKGILRKEGNNDDVSKAAYIDIKSLHSISIQQSTLTTLNGIVKKLKIL